MAVLLDGVPINDQVNTSGFIGRPFVLDTLSRIELIRGPGSAVHGSDAFHGVVSLESFSPDHDVYEGGGELGTDLYHNAYARMSQGLGGDLRLNVAAGYRAVHDQDQDFYFVDGTGTRQEAERDNGWSAFTGTAELEYEKDRFDAELAFTGLFSDVNEGVGIGNSLIGIAPLGEADVAATHGELYLGRARLGVALPRDVRAEASGYFWWSDDATQTTSPPSANFPLVAEVYLRATQYRTGTRLTFQQQEEGRPIEWVAGYEFTRREVVDAESDVHDFDSGTYILTLQDPVGASSRDIHSLLGSMQGKLFDDHLKLSVGGRVEHYSDFGLQLTPRAGVIVLPREWYALKLLYGRAFRAPAGRESEGATSFQGPSELDPEIIDTLELVFQIERERFHFGITGYGSIWTDGIAIQPLEMPTERFVVEFANVARNRAIGAEASFVYATESFRVDASASYSASEEVRDGPNREYSAFPHVIANLGVGYTLAPARLDFYVFQRLMAGMTEGVPPAPQSTTLTPERELDPYYRLDFHVSWEAVEEHLHVFANLRNAFAIDNHTPNLANAPGGNEEMEINASLGARVVY